MGGQVRAEVLRVSAGPRLPRRDPGHLRGRQGQTPETPVGAGRRFGTGVRQARARPHPGHARHVPRPGNGRAMAEGGRGRAGQAAPHRGRRSSRRCGQPAAVERRPARDGAGRRSPLREERPVGRSDREGLPGTDQVRRRLRRPLPHQAGGARGQGPARPLAGAQGSCLQRGQDARRLPRARASTSWDSTSAATAPSR